VRHLFDCLVDDLAGYLADRPRIHLLVCVLAALASFPLAAHHSFAAEYDGMKPITVTVTQLDWRNPHAYIYLDVKDESGATKNIVVEGHPPNILRRTGWVRDILKVQDSITVSGWASKDGSNRMAGRQVTLPGGNKLYWGPPSQ
jgi:hypothetical protein